MTSRRQFLTGSIASVALGSAFLAACGDDDEDATTGTTAATAGGGDASTTTAPAEPRRLTVMMPFPISVNFIADMVAKSGGFMEAEGIDLDVQFAPGAPQALQQLVAGNVTITRNGPAETAIAVANEDAPFLTIGMVNQHTNYTLTSLPESPLALADLGGTTVGLPTLGGNAEFTLDLLLESQGIDPATVARQAVGNEASAYGVMQAGQVDVLFVTRSASAAIRALGEEPAVDLLEDVNPLLGTNLVTTADFTEQRRDVIVSYLAALHAAMLAIHDPDQLPGLIEAVAADDWDLPILGNPEAANAAITAVANLWFEEGEENLLRNVPDNWDEGIAEMVDLGYLPEGSEATDFYTNDLLDEALG